MSQSKYSAQIKSLTSENSTNSKINWSNTNPKQIFDLIGNILTYKDCISYQLIPLDLKDRHLVIGIVNPKDTTALNYVRSCCANRVDSISTKQIDLKTHQLILSAYSRRSDSQKSVTPDASSMLQERPTLILDNPEEIEEKDNQRSAQFNHNNQSVLQAQSVLNVGNQKPVQTPLGLDLRPKYMSAPPRFLSSLPPQILWQELLARVLIAGNGRIQFERLPSNGRISWSQNGNLKLSIDPVAARTFQGVLEELKRLVKLPNIPVKQVYKGEIERSYKQERLLLLWRINPGKYGEEATLQVIRGKVLALYQKRQIEELGDQVIEIAKQLERKLEQIQNCRRINSHSWDKLSVLHEINQKINRQIKSLE
ncbi:MAG: hypothetical protein QNJ41_07175 [Xenococcaceae cyanobacterium MO_188.B32]|nr:hypothetical protein [Xenococcaceae cyanobacterium MO_188.B32]